MSTELIPRSRWHEFLDAFSRAHQGWLVTLETLPPRAARQVLIHDVPLLGVSDDRGRIVIAVAGDSSHSDRIVEAVAVRVEEQDGSERGLEIESPDGAVLRLRFHSAAPTELMP